MEVGVDSMIFINLDTKTKDFAQIVSILGIMLSNCSIKMTKNIFIKLCTNYFACHSGNRTESCTTCRENVFMMTVHSIFPIFHFQKLFIINLPKSCIFSSYFQVIILVFIVFPLII